MINLDLKNNEEFSFLLSTIPQGTRNELFDKLIIEVNKAYLLQSDQVPDGSKLAIANATRLSIIAIFESIKSTNLLLTKDQDDD